MQQYFGISKNENIIELSAKDFNHVKNVMRMKQNDEVFVVYDNKRYICALNEDLKSVKVVEELATKISKNEVVLYIPVLQDEKIGYILQKGTELGVTRFIPVEFEHCKYKLDSLKKVKKLERWTKIVTESSEQCYRNDIPTITNFVNVDEIVSVKGLNILCSLDTSCVKTIKQVLNTKRICDKISIVFGPEGGISTSEENIIVNNGYERVSLGKNILRTETVPLFVISIIKYLRGSE